MDILSEKKLRNLTTERLNALRKSVLKSRASAEYNADHDSSSQADMERAATLAEYYELIKVVMEEREHLERPVKGKVSHRANREVKRNWDQE